MVELFGLAAGAQGRPWHGIPGVLQRAAALLRAAAGLALCAGGLVACNLPPPSAGWDGPDGQRLSWSPAQPRFGDLVSLTARWPLDESSRYASDAAAFPGDVRGLFDPAGQRVAQRTLRYDGTTAETTWTVRVGAAGEWTWGKAGHPLWTIVSVAGQASEFKTFDAQGLWRGEP